MDSFEITTAQQADAAAIARVHVHSWQTTYANLLPSEYLQALDEAQREKFWLQILAVPNHGVFVLKIQNEIWGFISVGGAQGVTSLAEVYAFYLLERVQRQGYGRALWQKALRWLLEQGFESMMVWVLKENPSAAFYEKQGGHLEETKPITLGGTTLDEVCYSFQLNKSQAAAHGGK